MVFLLICSVLATLALEALADGIAVDSENRITLP